MWDAIRLEKLMDSQNFRTKLSQAIENSSKYAWIFYCMMFFLLLSLQITLFNPKLIPKTIAEEIILPMVTALALIPLTSFFFQHFSGKKSNNNIFARCIICKSDMEPIGKWKCTNPNCNGVFSNEKNSD